MKTPESQELFSLVRIFIRIAERGHKLRAKAFEETTASPGNFGEETGKAAAETPKREGVS